MNLRSLRMSLSSGGSGLRYGFFLGGQPPRPPKARSARAFVCMLNAERNELSRSGRRKNLACIRRTERSKLRGWGGGGALAPQEGEDPPGCTMTVKAAMKRCLALASSDQALPVTARRAKRENGGLGEDPPGSTMTY
jgi:hypothetical protein